MVQFKFHQSNYLRLELMKVERLRHTHSFAVSSPAFVHLPNFSGQIRIKGVRFSCVQEKPTSVLIPPGSPFVIERIGNISDLYLLLVRDSKLEIKPTEPLFLAAPNPYLIQMITDLESQRVSSEKLFQDLQNVVDVFKNQSSWAQSIKSPRGQRAMGFLEDLHQTNRYEITLSDLVAKRGYHISQISREFRQQFGLNPHRFWISLRLCWARWHLQKGESASEVAHRLAFSDQSHFTRWFKKYFFITPYEFQKESFRASLHS